MENTIKTFAKSSPGPDGVPFQAWKSIGELAVDVLWDVAKSWRQEQPAKRCAPHMLTLPMEEDTSTI